MNRVATYEYVSAANPGLTGYGAAIAETYAPMEMRSAEGGPQSRWAVSRRSLGSVNVSHVAYGGPVEGRIAADTSPRQERKIALMSLDQGSLYVVQGDRHATCGQHMMILVDLAKPLILGQPCPTHIISATVPTQVLQARCPEIEQRCGIAVPSTDGAASVLWDLLRSVVRERNTLDAGEGSVISRMLSSMVSCVFRGDEASDPRHLLIHGYKERIEQIIEKELQNPELCPALIAERLGVSRSYLFAVARKAGLSLGQLVLDMRLDRCRETLADPAWSRRSITNVAFTWGFKEFSHFSRRFSERFGQTPKEFRRSILGPSRED